MAISFKTERKCLALFLMLCILIGTLGFPAKAENKKVTAQVESDSADNTDTYFSYYQANAQNNRINDSLTLKVESVAQAVAEKKEFDSKPAFVLQKEGDRVLWNFDVTLEGCYALRLDYYNIEGKSINPSVYFNIDGKSPFKELGAVGVNRYWADIRQENNEFFTDVQGNDKLPEQNQIFSWQSFWIYDTQGMYDEPYEIYLSEGSHSLEIGFCDSPVAISDITLGQPEQAISYKEYLSNNEENASSKAKESVRIEAEKPDIKSSTGLYPQSDRTNASVSPNVADATKLNFIGGSNWCYFGESLVWEFDAPNNGWYTISLKARQNTNQGMNSYRALKIDGETPFKEAEKLSFPYNLKWDMHTLGGEKPYKFYLTKGKHTLELSCGLSELTDALRDLRQCVLELNALYREIIMITGTTPDVYQDYSLETVIPDLKSRLTDLAKRLKSLSNDIAEITGSHDTQASILEETVIMLNDLCKSPYTIPLRISSYKGDVESIGSLVYTLSQQPLSVDYIEITPENMEVSDGEIGFFKNIGFHVLSFLNSFIQDYTSVSGEIGDGKKALEVWVSSGRDQVKIINNLINDRFTPKTNVYVNLSLVDTGTTLIQATLAGKGPDVALMLGQDTPVNLAARGALVDLSKFDLSDIYGEFHEQSFLPFRYEGGLYGLPETQQFYMMFYRTDIFEQLGLNPPETWEEYYEVLNVLETNNLKVGIPEVNSANKGLSSALVTFEMLLYQNGGNLYTSDLKKTALDTEIANKCFEQLTELYTKYGLEQDYNFFNRMRSGEMAMAFENYTSYNQLSVAAPEINGLWSFAPVPGTVDKNGKLNRVSVANVTGSIVLKSAEKKRMVEEAVEFLKWWVCGDTQLVYANLLESTMGLLGRYSPANRKAFDGMNWSYKDANLINEQWDNIVAIPEIPGGYYVNRSITSALRSVIKDKTAPRRELELYNRDINNEITRKRKEFGLD